MKIQLHKKYNINDKIYQKKLREEKYNIRINLEQSKQNKNSKKKQ